MKNWLGIHYKKGEHKGVHEPVKGVQHINLLNAHFGAWTCLVRVEEGKKDMANLIDFVAN